MAQEVKAGRGYAALAWSLLEQGGAKAVQLVVQIVMARLLAPEAFGALAIMLVVIEVVNIVSQSGLGMAIIQREDAAELSYTTAFWLSLAVSAVLYVLLFALSPAIEAFYLMPGLSLYLRVLSLVVLVNAANSIQRSYLQKDLDFKALFKTNMSAVAISGAIGIVAAVLGAGVWALVAQTMSNAVIACAVMAFSVPWKPTLSFSRDEARGLFSYGWKIMATGILNVVYTGVSELILGRTCGPADLGLYSQGRKWPNACIGVVSTALSNVMFPAFAKMQGDPEQFKGAIRRAVGAGTFVIAPVSLLSCVAAGPLVELLLGEQWLACVPVFQVACAANCVLMLQLPNLRAYMALGDSGLYLRLQVIKVVASCAVIWPVAVLTRDIYWTAGVTAGCAILCTLLVDMHPAKRMHGVGRTDQLLLVAPALALSLAASAAAWPVLLLELPAAAALVAQLVVFGVVFLVPARLLHVAGYDECVRVLKRRRR